MIFVLIKDQENVISTHQIGKYYNHADVIIMTKLTNLEMAMLPNIWQHFCKSKRCLIALPNSVAFDWRS